MRKLKMMLLGVVTATLLMIPALSGLGTMTVSAAADAKSEVCEGIGGADGCALKNQPTINGTIKKIINVFSAVAGVTAVVMIIIAGFRFVTANGDSNTVSSARRTVLYAVVGLVIVALAQTIVFFVLENI